MNPIKSLYLPKDSLQGSEFPAHIIWDNSIELGEIRICLPDCIKLKEIYNVPVEGLQINERIITISEFEANGYIGLVFVSKKLQTPYVEKKIQFILKPKNTDVSISVDRRIILFRPEIYVKAPDKITIKYNARDNRYYTIERIKLKNGGRGTAIVGIVSSDDSEVFIKDPYDFEEFVEKLLEDIKRNFEQLKRDYPDQAQFINEFIELLRVYSKDVAERAQKGIDFNKKLKELLEKDEEFVESFIEAIGEAYLVNLDMFMELNALLKFIKSSIGNNIFLLNPTSIIEIERAKTKLKLDIYVTDLSGNEYSPLHSECEIVPEGTAYIRPNIKLPLYEIIEVGDNNEGN